MLYNVYIIKIREVRNEKGKNKRDTRVDRDNLNNSISFKRIILLRIGAYAPFLKDIIPFSE